MLADQVAQQTAQGDGGKEQILDQPVISAQAEVGFGQGLCPAAFDVLAGGEQFLFTALEDLADALQQGDVGVGQARFP